MPSQATAVPSYGANPAGDGDWSVLVATLAYGELAVALYASDMPTGAEDEVCARTGGAGGVPAGPGRLVDTSQVVFWAGQGVARLGGPAAVARKDREARRAVLRQDWATHGLVWPSPRRADTAWALAWRYRFGWAADSSRAWGAETADYEITLDELLLAFDTPCGVCGAAPNRPCSAGCAGGGQP